MTVVAVILLIAVIALIIALRKYIRDTRKYRGMYEQKQTKAFQLGGSQMSGDICQYLGTFAMLLEYEQLMTLSSTSSQGSLDLLAIGADSLDFIEFKKKDADLSRAERKIKRLIEQKKVNYVVKDVELPVGVCVSERVLKPSRIAVGNLTEAQ